MDATLQIAAALFLAVFVGAALPLLGSWTHRGLHVFVSVSAGIFLGVIFLHLLPELAGGAHGHEHGHGADHGGELGPWVAALLGLLLLFLLERVVLRKRAPGPGGARTAGADQHRVLWSATYLALALHSFSTGIGLAAWFGDGSVVGRLLAPLLLHKATEAFSLATVMRLAGLRTSTTVGLLALFAFVAPLGLVAGGEVAESGWQPVLAGFAVGTFLYVALMDLLPEVFHGNERSLPKLLALGLGVALAAANVERLEWAGGFALELARQSLDLFVEMAPFLLFGFLIAGLLSQLLKPAWLTRFLAKDDTRSVVTASVAGAPLPLCSCSVLPVAASLRKAGASKGATSSFLVATPDTGIDSVAVTLTLLGPLMAVVRPVAAVLAAIFTGSAVNAFVRLGYDREPRDVEPAPTADVPSCCAHEAELAPGTAAGDPRRTSEDRPGSSHERQGHDHAHDHEAPGRGGLLRRALRYAFVEMLDDLSAPLLVGILLAGAVTAIVPVELFDSPLGSGLGGMLAMLAIGIPIYVCAAASTPIAAALILKGLSPGAALVFLLASPATNLGSLYVIARYLGKRVVLVHVVALSVVTLLLGLGTDLVYGSLAVDAVAACHECAALVPESLARASAVLLAALMLGSLLRTRFAGLSLGSVQTPEASPGGDVLAPREVHGG